MDRNNTLLVAKELVTEHKGLKGQDLEDYIHFNFDDLWEHFDVNQKGLVEIERMSQFYKMLLKDMTIDLQ